MKTSLIMHTTFCLLMLIYHATAQFKESYPLRPTFHFVPNPPNWMNDPNGPFYDTNTGIYHLFFQYQTPRTWGHAISYDLLRWHNLPIAIENNEPYNSGGVFTGSTTVVNGIPTIMYVNSQENKWCLAYPNNTNDVNLTQWTNYANNCVLNAPQQCIQGLDGAPTTAWTTNNGKTWIMAYAISPTTNTFGNGLNAAAITYQTEDWITWTKCPKYLTYSNYTGGWDCIDFFELPKSQQLKQYGITHIVKASYENRGMDWWGLGTYNNITTEFIPFDNQSHNEMWNCTYCRFDFGKYYASKTFYDIKNDRQIIFGWIPEMTRTDGKRCPASPAKGQWCGMQSLPREIKILNGEQSPTGKPRLITYPIAEFNEIRIAESKYMNNSLILNAGDIILFDENKINGTELDIELEWLNGGDCSVWIGVNSDNIAQRTRIGVNFNNVPNAKTFYIDTSTNGVGGSLVERVVGWNGIDAIKLRIIVDHSVVTVFINDGIVVGTRRFYPNYNGTFKVGVAMFDHNGNDLKCVLSNFTAWKVQTVIEPPTNQ
eukprot:547240_1